MKSSPRPQAFTLVELLTVIAIIAVLMGLLFPAVTGVQNAARKAQAKNDCVQIVTAVKAYYTEYGKYPVQGTSDDKFGDGGVSNDNLFNVLRANGQGRDDPNGDNMNPRRIVFLEAPNAKEDGRYGIQSTNGHWLDPWGTPYNVRIDADYNNLVENPYTGVAGAGPNSLNTGTISYSYGKDGTKDTGKIDKNVLSWM